MDHLEVNPARLTAAADAITAASEAIDEHLAELENAARVLRTQWTGDAEDAFTLAHVAFQDDMVQRTEIVRTISTALTKLAESYARLDLESARALGGQA
ncbi:WXG100 family type VII secretion target [Microbacterium sp. GXF7504]